MEYALSYIACNTKVKVKKNSFSNFLPSDKCKVINYLR